MKQFIVLIGIILSASVLQAETKRLYLIGNSLTDNVYYHGFHAIAESQGHTHIWGRHMIPGAPIQWIWDHPDSGISDPPYGFYPNALPHYEWDVITLQPFDRLLDSDLAYSGNFIDLAKVRSPDVQFYIYAQWPRQNQGDFDTQWLSHYTGGWDGSNITKEYYELVTTELRRVRTDIRPVLMIPVGHVMYELNQRMKTGQVPGFNSIFQVYDDNLHLNHVGAYIIASTFFATIYRQDPHGLPVPSDYYGSIGPAVAAHIQDAAWQVVSTHPLSGVDEAVPPPGNLDAQVLGAGAVQLTWEDRSNGDSQEDYFVVERRPYAGNNSWQQIGTAPADSQKYTDSDSLFGLVDYTYRVGAVRN